MAGMPSTTRFSGTVFVSPGVIISNKPASIRCITPSSHASARFQPEARPSTLPTGEKRLERAARAPNGLSFCLRSSGETLSARTRDDRIGVFHFESALLQVI